MNQNNGTKKTVSEWWAENASLYSSYGEAVKACVSQLQVKYHSVYKAVLRLRRKGIDFKPKEGSVVEKVGLSEQELRLKHDALYKLEQAVKTLMPGKFIPEPEFRSLVAIDSSKFKLKSDLQQFDQYRGRVQGVVYWGNPRDIKRLKDEGVLV